MNLDSIITPTMIVDRDKVRQNIARMAEKARSEQIRFRPHFKTHQSAKVGEWFREFEVSAITVSSLEMAEYFAAHGWMDITVAFPLNFRQVDAIRSLARRVQLGVLVESVAGIEALGRQVEHSLDVWIKIDSGSGRTGIDWRDGEQALDLARATAAHPQLNLRGLLTHAGYTYSAGSIEEVRRRYSESNLRMLEMKKYLETAQKIQIELSVGDTPGVSLSANLGPVDEIRPGNFVFYDGQMLRLGACGFAQVAAVVACPVVALHPEREEALVYGGAIHLSKDYLVEDGTVKYGYVVLLREDGWSEPLEGAYAARLSQEHGVLHVPVEHFSKITPGGLVGIVPAHVCLTVSALRGYHTLEGEEIRTC